MGGESVKKKKTWLRLIALTLLVILCINNVGTIAFATAMDEAGSVSETEVLEDNNISEETISEEIPKEGISEDKTFLEQQEVREVDPNTQEVAEGYDIDFYVIIEGQKVKLQHNGITGIKTWKDRKTTYHGVSLDDLISVYEEFGFVKGSDGQNPELNKKFVSANRGKSGIEYGKVYTDEASKTYVSYNYGENQQGVAVDIYYLPKGMGTIAKINYAISKNTFYSVEVKGEDQDRIHYALTGTKAAETVSDFDPKLQGTTDRIEWTCIGTNDAVVDGVRNPDTNQTSFTINSISQSYVIQRADQTVFDLQFYVYADNEVRKLPSDSLKKVYKWNRQGKSYVSVSDLAEIYKEFAMDQTGVQQGSYFPYAVHGEKTLAPATVATYKGQQYVSYNLDHQETTVPTDIYYMPKGASDGEKVPDNYSDQIKQNKNSFYSVTVIDPDGNRTMRYYKKDSKVTTSVEKGTTQKEDWLGISEDEEKTLYPTENGEKLEFTIDKIEQPYTIASNTFAPETLNIKFYTFVNNP